MKRTTKRDWMEEVLRGEIKRLTRALQEIANLELSSYNFDKTADRFGQGYVDAKMIAIKALKP